MAVTITPEEVAKFAPNIDVEQVAAIIPGLLATAILAAPCLANVADDSLEAEAAKVIIIGAIARLAGSAGVADPGVQQESAGVFSVTYRPTVGTFSNKELASLRRICRGNGQARIAAVDAAPGWYVPGDRYNAEGESYGHGDILTGPDDCLECLL